MSTSNIIRKKKQKSELMHGNTLLFLVSKSVKLVLITGFLDNTFYFICISVTINCLISGFADSG